MSDGLKLYEIAESFSKLDEMAEDNKSLIEYVESVQMQLVDKVNNLVRFQRSLVTTAEAIDQEIQRLTEMKNRCLKKSDNLKNYLSFSMQKNGIEKINSDIATISFRKSKSVVITNPKLIPVDYVTTKVTTAPDKVAIKKAIESGMTIQGAELKESNNLQIK